MFLPVIEVQYDDVFTLFGGYSSGEYYRTDLCWNLFFRGATDVFLLGKLHFELIMHVFKSTHAE